MHFCVIDRITSANKSPKEKSYILFYKANTYALIWTVLSNLYKAEPMEQFFVIQITFVPTTSKKGLLLDSKKIK